jgi:hypothetical protein
VAGDDEVSMVQDATLPTTSVSGEPHATALLFVVVALMLAASA